MGGDLNTKKSWHPGIRKNQERVWKEEKAALEERKLIEKLRKEREEERQIEELQKMQEAAGGKVAVKRVDWMYAGPSGDGAGITEEREGYLLGKRRIDGLLKNDTQQLQKGAAVGIDAVGADITNTTRDTQKKVLQDPLLLIQKQKMEMQLKAAKEAQKLKQYEEKRAKEKEREKKHKHRHHHSRRDRSRSASRDRGDRERRHRRHRREDWDGRDGRDEHYRQRSRSRSRSPPRRDDHDDRDARDRYRRRTRSPSPYHNTRRDNYRKHSRSPRRRDDRDDRDNHRRRDRTPPPRRSYDSHRRPSDEDGPRRPRVEEKPEAKESMAERLAKMQADASSLEGQRNERVRLREAEDAAEEERYRNTKDGGHLFMAEVRSKAADALARGRHAGRRTVDV